MSAHEQLKADLAAAVAAAAPRHARRWRGGVRLLPIVAALVLAAGALAWSGVLSRGEISVPTHFGYRHAIVLAQSEPGGPMWRLFLRPCGADRFASGVQFRAGASYNGCTRRDPGEAISIPTWSWTPGITVVEGFTRPDVVSVRVTLRRLKRRPSGRDGATPDGTTTVATRLVPPRVLGHNISPMRFFVVARPYRVDASRLEALDARGRTLAVCVGPPRC